MLGWFRKRAAGRERIEGEAPKQRINGPNGMERVCFFAQQTFHDVGRSPLEEGSCRQTADDRGAFLA